MQPRITTPSPRSASTSGSATPPPPASWSSSVAAAPPSRSLQAFFQDEFTQKLTLLRVALGRLAHHEFLHERAHAEDAHAELQRAHALDLARARRLEPRLAGDADLLGHAIRDHLEAPSLRLRIELAALFHLRRLAEQLA